MDFLAIGGVVVFAGLMLALISGCAAMEKKR